QVKASGYRFAFTRASDGLHHPDVRFAANWRGTKSAGVVRGVYQFFRPAHDPVAQAALMLTKVQSAGGLQPGDLPPVLDIETVDGVATATIRARAHAWLTYVERQTGKRPLV